MRIEKKFSRLCVSFSGGKTSAKMAKRVLDEIAGQWDEAVVVFANTGQEHPKTLEYVDACDREYGLGVVWLEAVVDPRPRKVTGHRVVDFKSACRDGRLFEQMSAKYGIPNRQFPHCTRELKLRPMESYLGSVGWTEYNSAVGIRFDELDRMSPRAMDSGVFYPMIDWRETKESVALWERTQAARLGIPEHLGNCVWCWKKSFRKLATIVRESPGSFDVARWLEEEYKDCGAGEGDRRLFRGRKTVSDLVELARDPGFVPFSDHLFLNDPEMDAGMACGDGCEIGVDSPQEVAP